ncbi:methionyl-tRNA formyltransferase [Chishuiella changwenlii]|uniref:Methionyl-tRNA formyltransferase n=1 Tax=Chishuiella changwenlii TaxID=1434701 RepID=A0A1M6YED1_9FLAO|nr:methionyl-tRNA formyltransferase [Chishuiella changwenlii]GGE97583.1 methionyl-tRNA formyltransferase [Chishuiella changwenlii]SHL16339.1 methionyl-tRNA formyltransferase [Chishuiella changwenlii]
MRVVFMGTPEFAATSLHEINTNSHHEVVGVVTVPDKPSGRGQKIHISDVKKYAVENNLNLLQPEKLRDEKFVEDLKALNADVFVIVAFRMLPQVVWSIPTKGTFNLHGSLLPQYRGAAPINWAVMNGDEETGVTTFLIDEKIDTGNILIADQVKIEENDNVGKIHDELMHIGAKLVVKTLDGLENDTLKPHPQDETLELKHAPKIFKEDCKIDWNDSVINIHNKIRGLSPYPCAWTTYGNDEDYKSLKIYAGLKTDLVLDAKDFEIVLQKNNLYVNLPQGVYEILELQPEGKRRMSAKDFINGHQNEGSLFVK